MYTIITGATSGIGRALTYEFAKTGHHLIIIGRNEEKLKALTKEINKVYPIKIIPCQVDLCNLSARQRFVNWVEKEQLVIQHLINSAGVGQFGTFMSYDLKKDREMTQTNITALTELTKQCIPFMRPGSKILQVASTAAFAPGPYMSVYYATKAYVLSLGLALREELKGVGIGVSVLCPGPTQTPFVTSAQMTKSQIATMWAMTPESVARIAYEGMMANKSVIIPGKSNKLAAAIMRACPLTLGSHLVAMTQKKK